MSVAERLDRHQYLSLATFRRNGAEVRTPVWFAAVGDTLVVVSAGDAGKVKRLRRSRAARVAPCNARGTPQGDWRDATARLLTDADAIARAHAALRAKYGWKMWLLDAVSGLTGRARRRAWIAIEVAN